MEALKIGSVIEDWNLHTPFRVLKHVPTAYSPDTYILQNLFTGWTFKAHGIILYPDGHYEWDFSTEGEFKEVQK